MAFEFIPTYNLLVVFTNKFRFFRFKIKTVIETLEFIKCDHVTFFVYFLFWLADNANIRYDAIY